MAQVKMFERSEKISVSKTINDVIIALVFRKKQ